MKTKKTNTQAPTPKKAIAKKVVAKKVVKKVVKKTIAKATQAKQACVCQKACAPTQAFWVNNGPVVTSVEDLVKALQEMTDEQYAYHTKREGNDFAKWIQDCIGDSASAKELKKARTRVGAVRVLAKTCACL